MKFKLDENLSPTLAAQFLAAGHDAHSILEQGLGGEPDLRVFELCRTEGRALISLDTDFANIQRYPPAQSNGVIVLRLEIQSSALIANAVASAIELLRREPLAGRLWIVESGRIRIHS